MRRLQPARNRLTSNPAWAITGVLCATASLPAILVALAMLLERVT